MITTDNRLFLTTEEEDTFCRVFSKIVKQQTESEKVGGQPLTELNDELKLLSKIMLSIYPAKLLDKNPK